MKTENARRRRNDGILLLSILLIVVLMAFLYGITRKDGTSAVILKNGKEIGRYSLSGDCVVPIFDGDRETHQLVISEGTARITQAVCPDQICVNHRPVSRTGETIVCLPLELVVEIVSSESEQFSDLVS